MNLRKRENQPVPDFSAKYLSGNPISISPLKRKKIMLCFYRHVGCPFSNLRFLELKQQSNCFSQMGLVVLAFRQ
ncbi:redoxin domain-containing protein [Pedobacter sp. SAFR-022]|uniref:redoxin domain-containing protein n=1 Tax=Pedobacter sp. SAFR-022 TaxID=3436861 RepID=UPI003F7EE16C